MTPDQFTISEQMLDVSDGHSLYVHEWGNAAAKTTYLFLHGGPGGGCSDKQKNLFDASKDRVIFFDQRGSGKSTPHGSRLANTTKEMIQDITTIADHFSVETFVLVGGSWGSTLALAYGLAEPRRVQAMVLRGIFTGSRQEIDHLDKGKFQAFYPEVWEAYLARTPREHQQDPTAYHTPRALGLDVAAAKQSAYALSEFEGSIGSLEGSYEPTDFKSFDPSGIQIEIHYTSQLCFMPDRYIFDHAHELTMPIHLVQGRFDAVCPPITAYELDKLLPNSTLQFTISGHSGSDSGNLAVMQSLIAQFP